MRKFILSLAVVSGFIFYSIHEQQEGREMVEKVVSLPKDRGVNSNKKSGSETLPIQTSSYKDGSYTGSREDVFYGIIQVRATIIGGFIRNIEFLEYPNERQTSVEINARAMPLLKQEAISAQSARVDIITGATSSSMGFIASLTTALNQAK